MKGYVQFSTNVYTHACALPVAKGFMFFQWNIHCTVNQIDLYADSVNTSCYGILDAPMDRQMFLVYNTKNIFMYYR